MSVRVVYLAVFVILEFAAAQSSGQQLFAVFHADSPSRHREPGVVVIAEKGEWEKLLASEGNPPAAPVDFTTESVLVVTGKFLGEFCRNTAVKEIARGADGRIKVKVEETYPEKCSGGAVCRCSMVGGIPPPTGNTVIALKVTKPVISAEMETISVIDKCCPPK